MRWRGGVWSVWGVALLRPGRATAGRNTRVAEKKMAVVSRALQTSSNFEESTVISGVLQLLSAEAVSSCESKCEEGLATAFGVEQSYVGCVCPEVRRRRGLSSADGTRMDAILGRYTADERDPRSLRGLAEEDEGQGAAFAARVPGNLTVGVSALEAFALTGKAEVASAFDVQESEVWRFVMSQLFV